MDASLTGGLSVTLIGVGTVFTALLSLIGVIAVMRRLFSETPAADASARATEPETSPEADEQAAPETGPDLLPVALAAYALHLQIRGRVNAAPLANNNSAWALAGRVQELTPLSR